MVFPFGMNGQTKTEILIQFTEHNGEQEGKDGKVVDQIIEVVEQIKKNPDSRRLIVSAWNAAEIPEYGFSALSRIISVLCSRWKIVTLQFVSKKC